MRELKFRIGCISGNVFRYLDKDELFNLYRLNPYDGSLIAKDNGRNVVAPRKAYVIEQYTGLKDKNGKEIYEGDILKWKHIYPFLLQGTRQSKEYIDRVYWEEKDASFVVGDWFEPLGHLAEEDDIEVIGNIHEDEELLEAKNEIREN